MVEVPNPFEKAPAPKKKGGGLFGKHEEAKKDAPISQEMESTISRLRVLEERYTNLQAEVRVTEENMIHRHKKVNSEIKTITTEMKELKKEIHELKDKILVIIKELQGFGRKEDFKVLQRYVEMWEPLNFVTHKEVQEIVDERLKAILSKKR